MSAVRRYTCGGTRISYTCTGGRPNRLKAWETRAEVEGRAGRVELTLEFAVLFEVRGGRTGTTAPLGSTLCVGGTNCRWGLLRRRSAVAVRSGEGHEEDGCDTLSTGSALE